MADEFRKLKEQNPPDKDKDFPKGIFKPVFAIYDASINIYPVRSLGWS
jgi:hypothetical protein